MRRAIGATSATTTTTDQLQLLEVLGEGAFGKVYKGEGLRGAGKGGKAFMMSCNAMRCDV